MELIIRDAPPTLALELQLELLDDVRKALGPVARDLLPCRIETFLQRDPPAAGLRIPGQADQVLESLLAEVLDAVKAVTDAHLPVMPLRFALIVGAEHSGIEITPLAEGVRYPTVHTIHASDIKLRLTDYGRQRSHL